MHTTGIECVALGQWLPVFTQTWLRGGGGFLINARLGA